MDFSIQEFTPLDSFNSELPERFCYPHNYTPHPIAIQAAENLMKGLTSLSDGESFFGEELFSNGRTCGKMFGVLVVKGNQGQLGYIQAFSGKLHGKTQYPGFVPPVFDRLSESGFYIEAEQKIVEINQEIEEIKSSSAFLLSKEHLENLRTYHIVALSSHKMRIKESKERRRIRRESLQSLSEAKQQEAIKEMNAESAHEQYEFKRLKRSLREQELELEKYISSYEDSLIQLKDKRSRLSSELQDKLFSQYTFLNVSGETKELLKLFQTTPPSGAGDCAAPKLLQFAFKNKLTPLTMAEFWWGPSPAAEVRIHGQYYPACRGKCEPILQHMLKGLECDFNPVEQKLNDSAKIELIYSDEDLAVIHKPHELLSVPGKGAFDSVYNQVKALFPAATGPMIVHRLDMSTSGLMVVALNENSYKNIQKQFLEHKIKKRYSAILNGVPKESKGTISLPLRVDLDNRPHQLVCYEHGKEAITDFEVIETKDQQSKVYFYPKTGRTHQLRVHAAHPDGLGCPIVGDELYGVPSERLCLHADRLELTHPTTNKRLNFVWKIDFKF
ncbi:MAG: pseudouridine synthase [Cryomorphaceae bacterium]|nr:pseudouridine synthase [Cryomorphaceae bacterium]